jgi:hypothetical protein
MGSDHRGNAVIKDELHLLVIVIMVIYPLPPTADLMTPPESKRES